MSAWYLSSTLRFYPVSLESGEYGCGRYMLVFLPRPLGPHPVPRCTRDSERLEVYAHRMDKNNLQAAGCEPGCRTNRIRWHGCLMEDAQHFAHLEAKSTVRHGFVEHTNLILTSDEVWHTMKRASCRPRNHSLARTRCLGRTPPI